MHHGYLLAYFRRLKEAHSVGLKAAKGSNSELAEDFILIPEEDSPENAVNFTAIAKTRFCYSVNIVEECIKNRGVVKEMADDDGYLQ